jgi:hypothetical protein
MHNLRWRSSNEDQERYPTPLSPPLKILDDLAKYFEQYGSIFKVVIPFDVTKSVDMFKGYALVTFDDPEAVKQV